MTFQPALSYTTDLNSDWPSLVVADLDGNGRLDLVLGHSNWIYLDILLGNGDGTFGAPIRISTGLRSGPAALAVRDFNHDDHLDIVVTNRYANNIGIFLGKGNGTFNNQTKFSTGSDNSPFIILADDLNRDGHLDVAVITKGQLPLLNLRTDNLIGTHPLITESLRSD